MSEAPNKSGLSVTSSVPYAVPVADWQYQVTLGALVVVLLALGLLAGLVTGLGLKGLRGLFGPRS